MAYGLVQTSEPVEEPVSIEELKAHLRIDGDDEDDHLEQSIMMAREIFEQLTDRQLMHATWQLHLDEWPPAIFPPRPPLISVTSIKYIDTSDVEQTLAPSTYNVDTIRIPGRIRLQSEPALSDTVSPKIKITYTAGNDNPPAMVKRAIMLLAAHYYGNREAYFESAFEMKTLPEGFKRVVNLYWTGMVGSAGMK